MKRFLSSCSFRMLSSLLVILVPAASLQAEDSDPPLLLKEGLKLFEPREDVPASDLDVVEAYEEAQRLEAEIVEMFREMRAADLSVVQRQTLARSLEATLIPLSDRAEIDVELLRKRVEDADQIETYQQELEVVMKETDAIVANARSLLEVYLDEMAAPEASEEARHEEEEVPQEKQTVQEMAEAQEAAEREASEQLAQEAEEKLKETELNLEQALKEIQAAKEITEQETLELEKELREEKSKTEELTASKEESKATEKAVAEREKKREEWKELKEKVESAEKAVKEVLQETKTIGEASEEKLAMAEKAIENMEQALASAMSADSAASELAESSESEETASSSENAEKAKGHTQKAVRNMENASQSLKSASSALAALNEKSDRGGGDSDGKNAVAIRQAMGRLARARSGKWLDVTQQMRGGNLNARPAEVGASARPPLWKSTEELENAFSIRKVMADSRPGDEWYFVGDWYVLSRYDNEGRENLQKVYPPESILDLNAHYISEDGKRMQWEYASNSPPMVTPYGWESWKIYYFYTELYFEQETEAWVAIGSDDRSDLWINDLPVWHSANKHKGWTPDEGFRKVVFQPGHNKILLRLENGHQGLGFSLFLNFAER